MPAPTMLSTTWHPDKVYELVGSPNSIDWIGLDWIGLDWIGLDWIEGMVQQQQQQQQQQQSYRAC